MAAARAESTIAVASNFKGCAERLAAAFSTAFDDRVAFSFGATGKHYAQIRSGAPFAAFLAADRRRPERLEREGLAIPGSRFTYARGRLVLYSPDDDQVDPEGRVLEHGDFRHLALANPRLAPYGLAARQTLEKKGLWERLQPRLVRGENIGQAFQFVRTGNAELGFVAASQLTDVTTGSRWNVPLDLHESIEQQAILLRDETAARSFLAFLKSGKSARIVRECGYEIP